MIARNWLGRIECQCSQSGTRVPLREGSTADAVNTRTCLDLDDAEWSAVRRDADRLDLGDRDSRRPGVLWCILTNSGRCYFLWCLGWCRGMQLGRELVQPSTVMRRAAGHRSSQCSHTTLAAGHVENPVLPAVHPAGKEEAARAR